MARRPPLGVWLYHHHVAALTSTRPGEVVCRYTGEALDTWPGGTPILSCSLPLSTRPARDAGRYFRGLLPEGQQLMAMASAAGVPTYDTFGMLARFGRDVAGAVVVATEEPPERPGGIVPYTGDALAAEVEGLDDRPLALHDDSELSLAGLQNKLLLVRTAEGWARPVGGRPSTHILKAEDRRYPRLVTLEAACLHLARAVGLTTIDARVEHLADVDCLIVSRFDRVDTGDDVRRMHQEDSCQALGRDADAARGRGKYESAAGPSFRDVATLLDRHSLDPVAQLHRLVAVATFTALIGNADAHGKNLSLLHPEPGRIEVAPLYDTVPTALWPSLPEGAAMSINGRTRLADVTLDDLTAEARTWPMDAAAARTTATDTAEAVVAALDQLDVPDDLAALVRANAGRLLGP